MGGKFVLLFLDGLGKCVLEHIGGNGVHGNGDALRLLDVWGTLLAHQHAIDVDGQLGYVGQQNGIADADGNRFLVAGVHQQRPILAVHDARDEHLELHVGLHGDDVPQHLRQ